MSSCTCSNVTRPQDMDGQRKWSKTASELHLVALHVALVDGAVAEVVQLVPAAQWDTVSVVLQPSMGGISMKLHTDAKAVSLSKQAR